MTKNRVVQGFTLSALTAIAIGCSQAPDAAATGSVKEVAAELTAADGKPPFGNFDVTAPDGKVYREVLREDGTFSGTTAGGQSTDGEWEQRPDGIFCSRPKGVTKWRCKREVVGPDGVWTSTEVDNGEVSIVERVEP